MLRIILAWLLLALVCQGFGRIVQSLWRLASGDQNAADGWSQFWMGFAFLIAVLMALNFFVPLSAFVAGGVALISAVGFLNRCSRGLCARTSETNARERTVFREVVFWLIAGVVLALLAMKSATWRWNSVYDTDLYHFSWVRWAKEFAVVPGIANLHCRLGHTYGGLLLAAFVDHGWWAGRSAWIVPGFPLGAALLQWIHLLVRVKSLPRAAWVYALFTLPFLLETLGRLQPSLYTDEIAHILLLVAGMELLRHPPTASRVWLCALRVPLLLVAAAYAVKALSAVALLVFVVAAIVGWIVELRAKQPGAFRRVAVLLSVPTLLVVSVIARNSIATGWPLYPSPVLPLPVEWAVPRQPLAKGHEYQMQSAEGQYRVLKGWARRPGPHYGKAIAQRLPEWLPRWARQNWRGAPRFVAIAIGVCVGVWLLAWPLRRRSAARRDTRPVFLLLFAASASLVFWLLTAPDMRFGLGFFWVGFGASAALLFDVVPDKGWSRAVAIAAMLALVVWMEPMLKPASNRPWWEIGRARSLPVREVLLGGDQPFVVYAPREGDQCGDAPLPCTPYPLKELRMRQPGNLAAGFYLPVE